MKVIKGIPGAPGIAQGPVVLYQKKTGGAAARSLEEAAALCLENVRALYDKTLRELGEEQAKIFSAYEMLLEDPMLLMPVQAAIDAGTPAAQAAVEETKKTQRGISDQRRRVYAPACGRYQIYWRNACYRHFGGTNQLCAATGNNPIPACSA